MFWIVTFSLDVHLAECDALSLLFENLFLYTWVADARASDEEARLYGYAVVMVYLCATLGHHAQLDYLDACLTRHMVTPH